MGSAARRGLARGKGIRCHAEFLDSNPPECDGRRVIFESASVDAEPLDVYTLRQRLVLAGIVAAGAFFLAALFLVVVIGGFLLLLTHLGWEFFVFHG